MVIISTAITEYAKSYWRKYLFLMDAVLHSMIVVDNGGLWYITKPR